MDPSDSALVEILRPKTIPDGLLALGTVLQVTELQLKLQITGGIICIVDRLNINETYTKLLSNESTRSQAPRLTQIFARGQQYVCKILEKSPRKGYADALDIVATLDPSAIQEDNLPNTLFAIPQVPVQCCVMSVEDHGYQMDLGFKGLTGFLPSDHAESYCLNYNDGAKLQVGQVVRCCSRESLKLDADVRVVHLSLNKDLMKNSIFSRDKVSDNTLTPACVLPGSKAFLTVMKVRQDGLIVNLMNEFAGFVHKNHLCDQWHNSKENYKVSDQFKCTVLYYNKVTNTFALSLRKSSEYKRTLKQFIENYHVGLVIKKARVSYLDGNRAVVFKVDKNIKAIANVKDSLEESVETMTKDELSIALDSAFPDNSLHRCRIKSINLADLMLVLSLRQEFLDLPFVSVDELKPADFIEATVKKIVKDGVVVSFGLNLRAIILNSDLNEIGSSITIKKYPIGKKIKCRILKIDHGKQPARVYLTNKEQLMDPKLSIIEGFDRELVGKTTLAIVNKVKPNGLIVELFNNVKGFIPARFLSSTKLEDIENLFKIGQVVSAVVYRVEPNRQSMMLGTIDYQDIIKAKRDNKLVKMKKRELKKLARLEDKLARKSSSNNRVKNAFNSDKKMKPAKDDGSEERRPVVVVVEEEDDSTRSKSNKRDYADVEWDSDDSEIFLDDLSRKAKTKRSEIKRSKYLKVESGIDWSANYETRKPNEREGVDKKDDESSGDSETDDRSSVSSDRSQLRDFDGERQDVVPIKTRRQRGEEAKLREEKLREAENRLLDTERPPNSIADFERLVLKTPNSAEAWIKYSKFFLDNVETEKARIVCRRALRTINFRMEKEKLKVWLFLMRIDAKYGGLETMRKTLEEAEQTNDHLSLHKGLVRVLTSCRELDEAERIQELMLKSNSRSVEVWLDCIQFEMESRKDLKKARSLYDKACKTLPKSDHVVLKSKFGQFEFRYGDVERGKTVFQNLLSDNPKRTDLWSVYEAMVRKFATRQVDT